MNVYWGAKLDIFVKFMGIFKHDHFNVARGWRYDVFWITSFKLRCDILYFEIYRIKLWGRWPYFQFLVAHGTLSAVFSPDTVIDFHNWRWRILRGLSLPLRRQSLICVSDNSSFTSHLININVWERRACDPSVVSTSQIALRRLVLLGSNQLILDLLWIIGTKRLVWLPPFRAHLRLCCNLFLLLLLVQNVAQYRSASLSVITSAYRIEAPKLIPSLPAENGISYFRWLSLLEILFVSFCDAFWRKWFLYFLT